MLLRGWTTTGATENSNRYIAFASDVVKKTGHCSWKMISLGNSTASELLVWLLGRHHHVLDPELSGSGVLTGHVCDNRV